MNLITKFLSESNGNPSSMRILVAAIVLIQMLTWSYTCIQAGTLISWDLPDIGLIATALGAKAVQKSKEVGTDAK